MAENTNLLYLSPEEYVTRTNMKKLLEKIVISLLEKRPASIEKHIITFLTPFLPAEPSILTKGELIEFQKNAKQSKKSKGDRSTQTFIETNEMSIQTLSSDEMDDFSDSPLSESPHIKPKIQNSNGSLILKTFKDFQCDDQQNHSDEKPKLHKSSFAVFHALPDLRPPSDFEDNNEQEKFIEVEVPIVKPMIRKSDTIPFPSRKPKPYQFKGKFLEEDIFNSSKGLRSPSSFNYKEKRRIAIRPIITTNTQLEIKQIPKDKETFELLKNIFKNIQFFAFLTEEQREHIIGTMESKHFQPNEVIMKQGDPPEYFYIFQSGTCDVSKTENGTEKIISTISPGGYAGELGLISGNPRAATVTAKTAVSAWTIDKKTYWVLLREIHQKKRETYTEILSKLELLKVLDKYHIWLIIDALHPVEALANEVIINQGEVGDSFYMLIEGECSVSKPLSGNSNEIATITAGGFFGERALLLNEPRAATITAKTFCKMVKLEKSTFTRLLKPVIPMLLERIQTLYN